MAASVGTMFGQSLASNSKSPASRGNRLMSVSRLYASSK